MNLRGVPVFNAPGANANAVKELVLAGLLIASRNLIPAHSLHRGSTGRQRYPAQAGGRQQKAIRRNRVAGAYAGYHWPGRDRTAGGRCGPSAGHESDGL